MIFSFYCRMSQSLGGTFAATQSLLEQMSFKELDILCRLAPPFPVCAVPWAVRRQRVCCAIPQHSYPLPLRRLHATSHPLLIPALSRACHPLVPLPHAAHPGFRDFHLVPRLLSKEDLRLLWEHLVDEFNSPLTTNLLTFNTFKIFFIRMSLFAYHKPGLKKLILTMEGFMPSPVEIVKCFAKYLHLHDKLYVQHFLRTVSRKTQGDYNYRSKGEANNRTKMEILADRTARPRTTATDIFGDSVKADAHIAGKRPCACCCGPLFVMALRACDARCARGCGCIPPVGAAPVSPCLTLLTSNHRCECESCGAFGRACIFPRAPIAPPTVIAGALVSLG